MVVLVTVVVLVMVMVVAVVAVVTVVVVATVVVMQACSFCHAFMFSSGDALLLVTPSSRMTR